MSFKINQNIIRLLWDNKNNNNKSNEINLSMKKKNKSILNSITSTIQDELDINISPIMSEYSSISKGKKMNNKKIIIRKDEKIKINESYNYNYNKINSFQKFKFKNNKSHSLKSVLDTLNNNHKNYFNYKIHNFSHRTLNIKNINNFNKEEQCNIMKSRMNYFSKFNNENEKLDKILKNYFNIFEENNIEEEYNTLQKKRKNGIDILGKIIFDIDFIDNNKPIDNNSLKQIFKYQDEIFSSTNQIFEFLLKEIITLKTTLNKLKVNMKKDNLILFPKIKLNESKNFKIKDLKKQYQENENKFKHVLYSYQDEIENLTKLLDKNKEYYNKYNNSVDLLLKKNTEIKNMKIKEKDEYFKNQSIIENYKDKILELENEICKNKNDFTKYSDKNIKEKSILLNKINELTEENNQLSELLLMKEEELNNYILQYYNQKDIIKKNNLTIEFLKKTK